MRVVPDISWVPTVSCDVPPLVVLVVVDVVLVVVIDVVVVVVVIEAVVVDVEVVVVVVEVPQFMTAVRVVSLVIETALGLPVLPLSSQWSKPQEPYPLTARLYDWPLLRVKVTGVNPLPIVTPF